MGLFETRNVIRVCCPVLHITPGNSNKSRSFENEALLVFMIQGKVCQQIVEEL
jgi:hypothetical protein